MITPDDYEFYLQGEMSESEFYQWVGRCIKEWARAESCLFAICHRILATTRKHAAIIYYRTPNIDARLTLATELLLTVLPEQEKGEHSDVTAWRTIGADIRNLLPIRNIMAHSRVGRVRTSTSFGTKDGGWEDFNTSWMEIATSYEEHLKGRPEISIIDRQLPAHFEKLQSVLSRLEDFSSLLSKRYVRSKPPEESARRRTRHPSSRKAASSPSRPAKRPPPPGSSRA